MTIFAERKSPDDWSAAQGKPNSHEGRIQKGALLLDSEQGSNSALFHPRSAHAYLMVPEREQMRAVLQLKGSPTYLTKVTRRNMCVANLKVVPLSSSAQDCSQKRRKNRVRLRSMARRRQSMGELSTSQRMRMALFNDSSSSASQVRHSQYRNFMREVCCRLPGPLWIGREEAGHGVLRDYSRCSAIC